MLPVCYSRIHPPEWVLAVPSTHPCNHFIKNPVSSLLREYEVRTGATIANQFEGFRLRFGAGQPLVLAVLDRKYIQRRDHDIPLQKVGDETSNSVMCYHDVDSSDSFRAISLDRNGPRRLR